MPSEGEASPEETPVSEENLKAVREEKGADFQLLLFVSDNKCQAYFKFLRIDPGCTITPDIMQTVLDDAGICNGVDTNALHDIAEQCASGEREASEELIIIAQGEEPVNAEDGRVDFLVEPSPEDAHFDVENEETIDYKNTNLIQNVLAEQHLATIVQPCEPSAGKDIYGNVIQGSEGEPIKIKMGANVVMDDNKIFAQVNGRFILENEELSVNPVYQVRGDVDFTIGNINFIGHVEVQKDVLDDFAVFGKEGVEVNGIICAATVESDGDLTLNGGANGKNRGFIRTLGHLRAKYLNEVTVVCREGVEISKSIMNSQVKTKGKILCSGGNIIGGEVIALNGIDASTIGSDLGIQTHVISGVDYELEDRLRTYEKQLDELTKEIDRINLIIGPILSNKQKLMSLPLDKKKALKGLLQQLKSYTDEKKNIEQSLDELQEQEQTTKSKEIHVRKMLYSGVHVTIGSCKRLIKMEVKGPVRLREDIENDTVSITNLQL